MKQRAPRFMQEAGLEWLYRLSKNPRRLWKRYLVRGPKIFMLLPRIELRVRQSAAIAGMSREMTMPGPLSSTTVPIPTTSPSGVL